jgi:hypothetical protein
MNTSTEESESGISKKTEKSRGFEFIPELQPTEQVPAGSYFASFMALSIQHNLTMILLNPGIPRNHRGQPYSHHPPPTNLSFQKTIKSLFSRQFSL